MGQLGDDPVLLGVSVTFSGATLPKTNSSPLKMMVSNRNLLASKGPPFSGEGKTSGNWVYPPASQQEFGILYMKSEEMMC